jgi:hypothetical protein
MSDYTKFPGYLVLTNQEKCIWKSVIEALVIYGWPMSARSLVRAAPEASKRLTSDQIAGKLRWMTKLDGFPVSIHTHRADSSEGVHLYGLKDWYCDQSEFDDLNNLPAIRTSTQYALE